MAPTPLQQGDPPQVGRYRLTARLGAGGMGVVYLGDAGDGQQIAVKILRPEYAHDREFQARFRREVAAMTRVRNRYTVQVLDADTDSATPFIATQFADGPSLDEHVNDTGPLHPEAVLRLASALAEAIAAIHDAGVTHRDLKPSNVLLTNDGPMVIDFGIAQVADGVSITKTGMAIGSPGYMAPEQVTGRAGREADIFTWALIVAFAASGRSPFGHGEPVAILHRILSERPDISDVPPELLPLVEAALAREPVQRPSANDLLMELSGGTAGRRVPQTANRMIPETSLDRESAWSVPDTRFDSQARTSTGYPGPGPGRPPAGTQTAYAPPRRKWWPVVAATIFVLAVGSATGVVLLSNGNSHAGTPSGGASTSRPATGRGGAGAVNGTGAPTSQAAVVPQQPATTYAQPTYSHTATPSHTPSTTPTPSATTTSPSPSITPSGSSTPASSPPSTPVSSSPST